jgi:hypothetical protein
MVFQNDNKGGKKCQSPYGSRGAPATATDQVGIGIGIAIGIATGMPVNGKQDREFMPTCGTKTTATPTAIPVPKSLTDAGHPQSGMPWIALRIPPQSIACG